VRVQGERLRVGAQLIDAITANTIWTERYEADMADLFTVQDEITRSIALALQIKLTRGESARLIEGRARNLVAWQKMVLARAAFERFTVADNALCRRLLDEALASDPDCTAAMAFLGISHYWDARFSISLDQPRSLALAESQAERALTIEPNLSAAHVLKGAIALTRSRHAEAIAHAERACKLASGDAWTLGWLGIFSFYDGNLARADAVLRDAMRLSPMCDSWLTYYQMITKWWLGDIAAARAGAQIYFKQEPDEPYGFVCHAIIEGSQDNWDEARAAIARLREKNSSFGLANILSSERYREPERLDRIVGLLHEAGMT
jgi:tetratricopeptide (TPR) repeat protein